MLDDSAIPKPLQTTAEGSPPAITLTARSNKPVEQVSAKAFYEINPPKDLEHSAADFSRCLLALSQIKRGSFFDKLFKKDIENISFEIAAIDSRIHFFAVVPPRLATYFESQIASTYPKAKIVHLESDYLGNYNLSTTKVKELALSDAYYFPLRTYKSEKETDPLSAIFGMLSKALPDEIIVFQINIGNGGSWQSAGRRLVQKGMPTTEADGRVIFHPHPHAKLIEEKISQKGFETSLRLFCASPDPDRSANNIDNLAAAFGSLSLGEGNSLRLKKSGLFPVSHLQPFLKRSLYPAAKHQYLNVDEIATLFHLPDENTSQIKNIAWGGEAFNDPPQNLPVSVGLSDEEKQKINFFAKTEFKNKQITFGVKDGDDRRKHFYIIGKTGTGKSTLIANMAISDIRKGHGIAVIDPHGDLSEILLNYIPSNRINDVAYLEPFNTERSFHLNPFEVGSYEQADVVASGIVSIFYKLYSYSWGPRLEYILRNTVLTLVKNQSSTFLDVPKLLTDKNFREIAVSKLNDEVLKNFWLREFDKFSENFRQEAIAPILNKVGQFLSSPKIRNIVGFEHSTIDLKKLMDEEKIIILNLSQGRLGEDNAALLGALFITKFQLAAMSRVNVSEAERKDFYLYVDEFQNFATTSFVKILSEARKYRLNLTLANQYIAQVDETIQKAIFGNVGSIACFTLGAGDAKTLFLEFGKKLTEEELVNLSRYQIALKLSIDGTTSLPFLAQTLPLPECFNQQKDKVIRASLERYTRPINQGESSPQPIISPTTP